MDGKLSIRCLSELDLEAASAMNMLYRDAHKTVKIADILL